MNINIHKILNPGLIYDESQYKFGHGSTPLHEINDYFMSKYSHMPYNLNTFRVLAFIKYDAYAVRCRYFGGYPICPVWVDVEICRNNRGEKYCKWSDKIQRLYAHGHITFELVYDGFMSPSKLCNLIDRHGGSGVSNADDILVLISEF